MFEPWTPSWARKTPPPPSPAVESAFPTPYPVALPVLAERTLNKTPLHSAGKVKRARTQEELRALVRGLSAAERAQKLHDLMASAAPSALASTQHSALLPSQSPSSSAAPLRAHQTTPAQTFHDADVLGCEHYARAALASAPCCSRFFACRFCHDEAMDHTLQRGALDRFKCMRCGHEQGVNSDTCEACHGRFGRYFCKPCRFLDDSADKKIFHCAQCGVCRVGERADYFHCDQCGVCMAVELKGKHKCVERSLESGCPVCAEFMFTSTAPIRFFDCGHAMHLACFDEYRKSNYVCPLCSKSLGDTGDFVAKVDEIMKHTKMPAAFAGVKARVFCADCEKRSTVAFHFVYHKCADCGSYNTKLLERFRT